MPVGDANVIEILPSAVPGVRRMLLRSDAGAIVEAVELPAARLAALPSGGLFSAFEVRGPLVILGPPLQRRFVELRPPPAVVLGLLVRLLEDLELLHRGGGAHGALHLDGIGVDERGQLVVRPVLHVAQELSALADTRAVGAILATLADRTKLEAAGVARASLLLSGLGVGSPRAGFLNARAAGQALAVVVRGLRVEETRDSFLAASGVSLPRAPTGFRVRPVEAVAQASSAGSGARAAEARAWLDRSMTELQTARFDREATLDAEAERLTEALRRQTETTLNAARAVAEGEAERLVRSSAMPPPAMLFVGAGVRPPVRRAELEEEDTIDAASADGAALAALGPESVIEGRGAPDGGDSRAETAYERDAALRAEAVAQAERHREQEERIAAAEAEIAAAEAARLEDERRAEEARRAEAARAEAARVAAEGAERVEAERLAEAEAEAERAALQAAQVEAERAAAVEAARIEAEARAAAEILAEAARVEAEQRAQEETARVAAEVVEAERAEAARLAAAEAEVARIEAEDAVRIDAENAARAEGERLAREEAQAAAEAARIEGERVAADEAAKIEAEAAIAIEAAIEAARAEAEAAEKIEEERQAGEAARVEAERVAAEEAARIEAEGAFAMAAAIEAARIEAEAKAAAEAAWTAAEREAAEEAAKIAAERRAAEAEAAAAARIEAEEAARIEAENAARVEAARLGAEAAEAARIEAERVAAEEAARIEAERAAAEAAVRSAAAAARAEAARIEEEAARLEAAEAEAHAARRPAPRAREPEPEAWPDHPDGVSDDAERGGVARWEGLGGVRGDPSRMNEKGPGKWTSQGRSREELAEQLPPGESRPMDMSPPEGEGSRLGIYIAVAVGLTLLLAWWAFG